MIVKEQNKCYIMEYNLFTLIIEPWGHHSLRIQMTKDNAIDLNNWALISSPSVTQSKLTVHNNILNDTETSSVIISNGKISVHIDNMGQLCFCDSDNKPLLEEYSCNNIFPEIASKELFPIPGTSDYQLTARFKAYPNEMIFGMGQYQEQLLNKKGACLELYPRHNQSSVPFYISNRGFGFLWNNPAIGTVSFASNKTEWFAKSTKKLDYFITAGDSPSEILENYAKATGYPLSVPEKNINIWQYLPKNSIPNNLTRFIKSQKNLDLPNSAIVSDSIQQPSLLENSYAISLNPIQKIQDSEFKELHNQAYLIPQNCFSKSFYSNSLNSNILDITNPKAQKILWSLCKTNYYNQGIHFFYLNQITPLFHPNHLDFLKYDIGPALQCHNIYPLIYAQIFYEGLSSNGEYEIMNFIDSAWAGIQKYGAVLYTTPTCFTFQTLRDQLQSGLSLGMSGIPLWVNSFNHSLDYDYHDPDFQELFVRWFQLSIFCPFILLQTTQTVSENSDSNLSQTHIFSNLSAINNAIIKKFILIRKYLHKYILNCMEETHLHGTPIMRPLFYDFPNDSDSWIYDNEYMFGPDLLIAPIMDPNSFSRSVYLPAGTSWTDALTGKEFKGAQNVIVDAPLDIIPVFIKQDSPYSIY